VSKAIAITIFVIVAVAVIVFYMTQRQLPPKQAKGTLNPTPAKNDTYPGRRVKHSGAIMTDAHDPEFVQRVLPVAREFFATLDRAGVNPVQTDLPFNTVELSEGPNGLRCRFLIGDRWSVAAYVGSSFTGIMHFGERGPDNPYRAISHANTNALKRLSERAIKMPREEAERIINHISSIFGIDTSKFENPRIYPERMFEYDLGMYTTDYRKKGTDPINQLNYPISFSIRATSPTSGVLVMYMNSGER
jgi:hypothetical protein